MLTATDSWPHLLRALRCGAQALPIERPPFGGIITAPACLFLWRRAQEG